MDLRSGYKFAARERECVIAKIGGRGRDAGKDRGRIEQRNGAGRGDGGVGGTYGLDGQGIRGRKCGRSHVLAGGVDGAKRGRSTGGVVDKP